MKKFLFSPIFLTVWLIISSAISISLIKSLLQIREAKNRTIVLEERNAELLTSIDGLQVKILDADTTFAKERIIREELGLHLPGEIIVQLEDKPILDAYQEKGSPIESSQQSVGVDSTKLPVYRQWLELFFGD